MLFVELFELVLLLSKIYTWIEYKLVKLSVSVKVTLSMYVPILLLVVEFLAIVNVFEANVVNKEALPRSTVISIWRPFGSTG